MNSELGSKRGVHGALRIDADQMEFGAGDPLWLFAQEGFECAMLIDAANHLIRMGEGPAVEKLNSLLTASKKPELVHMDELKVAWLCRILFTPKESPIRGPRFGWHGGVDRSEVVNWPLYPLAQSGNSFFVLATHYRIAGMPEEIVKYIDYCQDAGEFRTEILPMPSMRQQLLDARHLIQSTELSDLFEGSIDTDCLFLFQIAIPSAG